MTDQPSADALTKLIDEFTDAHWGGFSGPMHAKEVFAAFAAQAVAATGCPCGRRRGTGCDNPNGCLLLGAKWIPETQAVAASQIWGFYEEKYPLYVDGKDATSELLSPATAAEINGLVARIKELEAASSRQPLTFEQRKRLIAIEERSSSAITYPGEDVVFLLRLLDTTSARPEWGDATCQQGQPCPDPKCCPDPAGCGVHLDTASERAKPGAGDLSALLKDHTPDKNHGDVWPNEREIGFREGWELAHEPAKCGHARANWKDPTWSKELGDGTPGYKGQEKCEFCAALAEARRAGESAMQERCAQIAKEFERDERRLIDARVGAAVIYDHIRALTPSPEGRS